MTEKETELDITAEEVARLEKAFKDEKFKELFFDYCKEISDPENKAKYELEIQQLEKERGFDVTFVKPEAGHVIKVIDTKENKKVFINVCTNVNVEAAKVDQKKKGKGKVTGKGQNWTVPHLLNPPRDDVDKGGAGCKVCDVVFHPDVYSTAVKQPDMMKMLNGIALDTSEEKFGYKFDRNNIKYPKLKYKGRAESTIVRNKDGKKTKEPDEFMSKIVKYPDLVSTDTKTPSNGVKANDRTEKKITEINGKEKSSSAEGKSRGKTTPKYKILHRGHFDMQDFTLSSTSVVSTRPAKICVEVELPLVKSVAGVDLDVFEKQLVLESEKPNYYLSIPLPYPVDEDKGRAQFDKSRKVLVVTLPVLPFKPKEIKAKEVDNIEIQQVVQPKGDSPPIIEDITIFDQQSKESAPSTRSTEPQNQEEVLYKSQKNVYHGLTATEGITTRDVQGDINSHNCDSVKANCSRCCDKQIQNSHCSDKENGLFNCERPKNSSFEDLHCSKTNAWGDNYSENGLSRESNNPAVVDDNAESCFTASAKSQVVLEDLDDSVEESDLRAAQKRVDLSRGKVAEDNFKSEAMNTIEYENCAENLGDRVKDTARIEFQSLDNKISSTRQSEVEGEMNSHRLVRATRVFEEEGVDDAGSRDLVETQGSAAKEATAATTGTEAQTTDLDARQVTEEGEGLLKGNARQGLEKGVGETHVGSGDYGNKVEKRETVGSNTDRKEIKAEDFPKRINVEADCARLDISSGFVSDNRILEMNPGANKTLMEKNSQRASPDCDDLCVNTINEKAAENHGGSPANTLAAATNNVDKCIEGSRGFDFGVTSEDYDVDDIAAKLETMDFAIENVADIAGMNRLPAYDYDQDEESVKFNINLPHVKMEDVSLGFSSRKVYFSMMQEAEQSEQIRWCLVIKFLDYCHLNSELCTIDVEEERVVLNLRKTEDSCGLWNKFHVGTTEKTLQEMFFLTDHSMSELLGRLQKEDDPWAKRQANVRACAEQGNEESATATNALEEKLSQLLRTQERTNEDCIDVVDNAQSVAGEELHGNSFVSRQDVELSSEDMKLRKKSSMKEVVADKSIFRKERKASDNGYSSEDRNSSSSDYAVEISLDELQDDVICDTLSPLEHEAISRMPIERSQSDDTHASPNPRLRSILKRSKSDSADAVIGYRKGKDNERQTPPGPSQPSIRLRSQSLNFDCRRNGSLRLGQTRNKSVSFDPEPKVCEFVEYSKKQLKKMRKQERKQNEIATKKLEAAAKKAQGKHKGGKNGRNRNFFNGFRSDSKVSDSENDDQSHKQSGRQSPVAKTTETSNPLETTNTVCTSDKEQLVPPKSSRKFKKKKKSDKQDQRTLNGETKVESPSEQLTNSLIFELDS